MPPHRGTHMGLDSSDEGYLHQIPSRGTKSCDCLCRHIFSTLCSEGMKDKQMGQRELWVFAIYSSLALSGVGKPNDFHRLPEVMTRIQLCAVFLF